MNNIFLEKVSARNRKKAAENATCRHRKPYKKVKPISKKKARQIIQEAKAKEWRHRVFSVDGDYGDDITLMLPR